MFDTTINMGNLIQIIVMIIGGIAFLWRMEARVLVLSEKLENIIKERHEQHNSNTIKFNEIEEQLKKLIEVAVELARVSERMTALDVRVQEMSNRITHYIKPTRSRNKG